MVEGILKDKIICYIIHAAIVRHVLMWDFRKSTFQMIDLNTAVQNIIHLLTDASSGFVFLWCTEEGKETATATNSSWS